MKLTQAEVLNPFVDYSAALQQAALKGYAFCPHVILPKACQAMEQEVSQLEFEAGDYSAQPIEEHKRTKVTQRHERFYRPIDDCHVPIARLVSQALISQAHQARADSSAAGNPIHDLANWAPSEIGYQRYRDGGDHISPHRDRRTDQFLGATVTIHGSALVRIHEPLNDPDDYTDLSQVDECETSPGSLMLLRAPGFGVGRQAIHEVLPPRSGSRLILNLRMRPDVLKAPNQEAK
ncbi:MAG: hypothetical protein ACR2KZ_04985 [Segetibacter sp.]